MIQKMILKLKVRIADKNSKYEWEEEKWLQKTFKNVKREFGEIPVNKLQTTFEKEIAKKYKLYSVEDINIIVINEE